VRDWFITEQAGLSDLAWEMCRDAYVSSNDAKFLLDELEAHLTKNALDGGTLPQPIPDNQATVERQMEIESRRRK
jgi:hypothetical protein